MDTELKHAPSQGSFRKGDPVLDASRKATVTVGTVKEEPFSEGDEVYHRKFDICTVVVGSALAYEGKARIVDDTDEHHWVDPSEITLYDRGPNRKAAMVCYRDTHTNERLCVPPDELVHVRASNRKTQPPDRLGHTPSATQTRGL